MGNEKTDWMIYSDREMSVMSTQEEKVSFKELKIPGNDTERIFGDIWYSNGNLKALDIR